MKTFTFKYEKNPKKSALLAMQKAIQTGNADIRDHEMVCDGLDSMLKLMSKSRFDVFAAIVENRPHSIYDLAKSLEKDQGNVLRDVKALESLGLIKLKPMKNGARGKFKPLPLYDRVIFEFEPKKMLVNE